MYPHPFLLLDGGRGMGEPCQVVLNMRGVPSQPSGDVYTTHMEVFYLVKTIYVHLLGVVGVVIKIGYKGCFWWVSFGCSYKKCVFNRW